MNRNKSYFYRCGSKECYKAITNDDYLIVQTEGVVEFTDKAGTFRKRQGMIYLHFLESCLKSFQSDFNYMKIAVQEDTKKLLKKEEREYLETLGIKM